VGRIKRTIYCGGLGEHASVANFQITFAPFGEIKTIEVPTDHVTGAPRGFGFIEFEEREDALAAIDNMHRAEAFGRCLNVAHAKPQIIFSKPIWDQPNQNKFTELANKGRTNNASENNAKKIKT